jgi:hypothetical protein
MRSHVDALRRTRGSRHRCVLVRARDSPRPREPAQPLGTLCPRRGHWAAAVMRMASPTPCRAAAIAASAWHGRCTPSQWVVPMGGRHGTLLCMVRLGDVGLRDDARAGEPRNLQRLRGGARVLARRSGAPPHPGGGRGERSVVLRPSAPPPPGIGGLRLEPVRGSPRGGTRGGPRRLARPRSRAGDPLSGWSDPRSGTRPRPGGHSLAAPGRSRSRKHAASASRARSSPAYASVERTLSRSSRTGTSIATTPSIGSAAGSTIAASACRPIGTVRIFWTDS